MAYKDIDKQREAVRAAVRRNRAKRQGVIPCNTQPNVIPEQSIPVIPVQTKPYAGELTKTRQTGSKGFNA